MEWLCEEMELTPGMRVLDMGRGKGMSSVFLAKEYGVQVWTTDLRIAVSDSCTRLRQAGVAHRVFPLHAEARTLPYAEELLDAIVPVDLYQY